MYIYIIERERERPAGGQGSGPLVADREFTKGDLVKGGLAAIIITIIIIIT